VRLSTGSLLVLAALAALNACASWQGSHHSDTLQCNTFDLGPLREFDDLYIGEIHGTNEVPALIGCLVLDTVNAGTEDIIVSLEIPPSARNPRAEFWKGTDGRASLAVQNMLSLLIELESQNRIKIDFHRHDRLNKEDQRPRLFRRPDLVAEQLEMLAKQGHLIAWGGNFHNSRKVPEGLGTLKSDAMYMSDNITMINVVSREPGMGWFCTPQCGETPVAANKQALEHPQSNLYPDPTHFHDFAYVVRRFSSSRPFHQ